MAGGKAVLFAGALMGTAGICGGQTTSALAILNQAPKVHIEDPTPAAPARTPVPYAPQRGAAPPVATVYPAFTPYGGNSVRPADAQPKPDYLNYGDPVAPPPGMDTRPGGPVPMYGTPTPRPVLGPEDVTPKKKKGFVRGLINAIPFVGGDDEPEATPTPTPMAGRTYERAPQPSAPPDYPVYRGYDSPEPSSPPDSGATDGKTLLRAPGDVGEPVGTTPERLPSSVPIMTPTPRGGGLPDSLGPVPGEGALDLRHDAAMDSNVPVLTVKREGDDATSGSAASSSETPSPVDVVETPGSPAIKPSVTPGAAKQPSVSRSLDDVEPISRTVTPSGVVLEELAPVNVIEPAAATEPPEIMATVAIGDLVTSAAPEPVVANEVTSLTIEQADLGMPNPTYEQNTTILGEFQDAVRTARRGDYSTAALLFREYATNHPSSGLTPRAFYLSVVFEKNNVQAKASLAELKKLYPKSHYVKEAETRRGELVPAEAALAEAVATPAAEETAQQKVDRLEKELTAAVGDPTKEPGLRRELGAAYLQLEEYDRAWEVLRPALEMVAGRPEEAQILLMMARCQMARKDIPRAMAIVDDVEAKYPGSVMLDAPTAWNAGLVYEAGGRYAKARAIYNGIRTNWPDSQEAKWSVSRLQELAVLIQ